MIKFDYLTNYIVKKSKNQSLIICGDFNINYKKNASDVDNFISNLNLKSHSSINSDTVDYIFYRDSNYLLFEVKDENMEIDSLDQLSDHAPLSILFNLLEDKRN